MCEFACAERESLGCFFEWTILALVFVGEMSVLSPMGKLSELSRTVTLNKGVCV